MLSLRIEPTKNDTISISALLHVYVFVFVIGMSMSKPHLVEFLDEMSVYLSSVCMYIPYVVL